jgi:hypothetical protein
VSPSARSTTEKFPSPTEEKSLVIVYRELEGKFSLCSKLCCNDSRSGSEATTSKKQGGNESLNDEERRKKKFATRSRESKSTREFFVEA